MVRRSSRGMSSRSAARINLRSSVRLRSSRAMVVHLLRSGITPVVGEQTVQYVVHGDRAEQSALLVHDGRGDQVVGGEVLAHNLQTVVRPQPVQVRVQYAGHQG